MLTPTQLAAALGVSKQMISLYKRDSKITPNAEGLYDLETARRQLAQNLGSKKGGVPRRGQSVTVPPAAAKGTPAKRNSAPPRDPQAVGRFDHISKADLEKAALFEQIRRKKRENDVEEGKLIKAEDAVEAWGRMITSTRATILLVPDKLAPKVAPVSDVRECRQIVAKEMNALLSSLSEYRPNE